MSDLNELKAKMECVADIGNHSSRFQIEEGDGIVADAWKVAFMWLNNLVRSSTLIETQEYKEGIKLMIPLLRK